jgi:WhiB family transcriptional regulator, redox-sensing transcriptional regulator
MDYWRDQAACRHEDPELFFPIGTSGPALMQTEQAKAVCARCPVREQCLEWALDHGEILGVWGGTGEAERRTLQRRRRRAAARNG